MDMPALLGAVEMVNEFLQGPIKAFMLSVAHP
jgi:hypothetical protein